MTDTNDNWHKALPALIERRLQRHDAGRRRAPQSVVKGAGLLMRLLQQDNDGLSEDKILEAVHENPMFFAGICLIASQVASTDIFVTKDGVIDRDHPVEQLFEEPNRFHTKYTFFWLLTAYLLSTGTSYVYRLDSGAIVPVPPTKVLHRGGTHYQVQLGDQRTHKAILGNNLAKLRLPNLREPYLSGSGYGAALAEELDIASAAAKHESSVLHNNARPDVIVNLEGVQPDALKQTKESWEQAHRGENNSGKVAWHNADNMTVKTLNTSFKDLGFIELRKYSSDVIRQTLGIPPELLGQIENANRATIESAFFVFAKTKLEPTLAQIVAAVNKDLLPLITEDDVRVDHEDVVPEDKDFKKEMMKTFPQSFTVNEARRLAGYEMVQGGDIPLKGNVDMFPVEGAQRHTTSSDADDADNATPLQRLQDDFTFNSIFEDLKINEDNEEEHRAG